MSKKPWNPEAMVHVYPQESWHHPAHIVGNTTGLLALRRAIDRALGGKKDPVANITPCDGEGYHLHVHLLDAPFGDPEWDRMAVPYTDEIAKERDTDAVYPAPSGFGE